MGLGIYPVLKPHIPEAKFDYLGELLTMQFEVLDELASEHGIIRIRAFGDPREVPEDFDGPPEELEKVMGPWEDWFSCRDGMLAFEALAKLATEDPVAGRRLKSPDAVAAELRAIASVLAIGEERGSKFRLEMC